MKFIMDAKELIHSQEKHISPKSYDIIFLTKIWSLHFFENDDVIWKRKNRHYKSIMKCEFWEIGSLWQNAEVHYVLLEKHNLGLRDSTDTLS